MSKEMVKEAVVKYLINELNVPEDMIEIDTPLSAYEDGVDGNIDITVTMEADEDVLIPLMIIQCLDDEIEMSESLVEKEVVNLEVIDGITGVGRIMLTNGVEMMYADWKDTDPNEEPEIPTYEQMVQEYNETGN